MNKEKKKEGWSVRKVTNSSKKKGKGTGKEKGGGCKKYKLTKRALLDPSVVPRELGQAKREL